MADRSHERLHYLDALRGVAALIVVFSHYFMMFGLADGKYSSSQLEHPWYGYGAGAVNLFFVLSGVVLSYRWTEVMYAPLSTHGWVSYSSQRLVRIWPPYVAALGATLVALRYMMPESTIHPSPSTTMFGYWMAHKTLWQTLVQLQLVKPVAYLLLPQAWSLQVELVLSIFLPLLIVPMLRSAWGVGLAVLAAIAGSYTSIYLLHFLLGGLIAVKLLRGERRAGMSESLCLLAFVLGLSLCFPRIALDAERAVRISPELWNGFHSIGAALAISACVESRALRRVLSTRALVFLGTISYSLYLTHWIVLMVIVPRITTGITAHDASPGYAWQVGFWITPIASCIFATLFHFLLEKPLVRLAHVARRSLMERSAAFA